MVVFFLFLSFFFAQQQTHIDGIAAVVGNRAVLKSEALEQTLMLAQQKQINPKKTPLLLEKLYNKVLEEKINRLVVLFFANKDTSLFVDREEVNNSLDERIGVFIDAFGSKKAMEDSLKMTTKTLKEQYWDMVKDEILVEKFRHKEFAGVSVNREEVVSFFTNNPDSFPPPPILGSFTILQKPVSVSQTTKDSLFSLASALRTDILLSKTSFEEAAKKHSQHSASASSGGFLPSFSRGSFLPAFERVAFSLKEGELSSPFETPLGLHLIRLNRRVGEKITTQQILFLLKPSSEDLAGAVSAFEKIKRDFFTDTSLLDSVSLVFRSEFNNSSGYFENFNIDLLPLFLQGSFHGLENYSFSDPFFNEGSLFLFYKYTANQELPLSLEKDWGVIERVVLNQKKYELFVLWINNRKKDLYIKVFSQ